MAVRETLQNVARCGSDLTLNLTQSVVRDKRLEEMCYRAEWQDSLLITRLSNVPYFVIHVVIQICQLHSVTLTVSNVKSHLRTLKHCFLKLLINGEV